MFLGGLPPGHGPSPALWGSPRFFGMLGTAWHGLFLAYGSIECGLLCCWGMWHAWALVSGCISVCLAGRASLGWSGGSRVLFLLGDGASLWWRQLSWLTPRLTWQKSIQSRAGPASSPLHSTVAGRLALRLRLGPSLPSQSPGCHHKGTLSLSSSPFYCPSWGMFPALLLLLPWRTGKGCLKLQCPP